MDNLFQQIEGKIKERKKWLIVSHINPDGDALGSTLAVHAICKQWGITSVCLNQSPIPEKYRFLPGVGDIQHPEQMTETFDAVIMVDSADRQRIGELCEGCIAEDAWIINIDHHATNEHYGHLNAVEPTSAATAEVLYKWVEMSPNIEWNLSIATCIYTGILDDTGGFRYSNTSSDVLRYASNMLEIGVPANAIAENVLETVTRRSLSLLQIALSNLQSTDDGQIAWMSLSKEEMEQIGATDEDLDGMVNYARNIVGVDVGLLFREGSASTVKVSLRSREKTNVANVARFFGGGGHIRAAGCTVQGNLEAVIQRVIRQVKVELEGA